MTEKVTQKPPNPVRDRLQGAIPPPSVGQDDFEGWLQARGLWDPAKNRQEMYIRYLRLKGVRFGLVPKE